MSNPYYKDEYLPYDRDKYAHRDASHAYYSLCSRLAEEKVPMHLTMFHFLHSVLSLDQKHTSSPKSLFEGILDFLQSILRHGADDFGEAPCIRIDAMTITVALLSYGRELDAIVELYKTVMAGPEFRGYYLYWEWLIYDFYRLSISSEFPASAEDKYRWSSIIKSQILVRNPIGNGTEGQQVHLTLSKIAQLVATPDPFQMKPPWWKWTVSVYDSISKPTLPEQALHHCRTCACRKKPSTLAQGAVSISASLWHQKEPIPKCIQDQFRSACIALPTADAYTAFVLERTMNHILHKIGDSDGDGVR
jgi:hypothetical protein